MSEETNWEAVFESSGTNQALQNRQQGIPPRFEMNHECRECHCRLMCPDRYVADSCKAKEYAESMKWAWDYTCTPCIMKMPDEQRDYWYQAHGLA